MPSHIPLHWFVFLSRIAFVDTIFPYLKEREKKKVIIAQWRHLKHHKKHGQTHSWAGRNQANKLCTPISQWGDLFSPVLCCKLRRRFPTESLGWTFKNAPVGLSQVTERGSCVAVIKVNHALWMRGKQQGPRCQAGQGWRPALALTEGGRPTQFHTTSPGQNFHLYYENCNHHLSGFGRGFHWNVRVFYQCSSGK